MIPLLSNYLAIKFEGVRILSFYIKDVAPLNKKERKGAPYAMTSAKIEFADCSFREPVFAKAVTALVSS